MALPGTEAQSFLNSLVQGASSVWAGIFTTAPADNDTGSVEVSGGSYARVQVAGSVAATASWTTSTPNITMNNNPGWVVPGMAVYDTTNSQAIGTVSTYVGTALVLTANALHASSGSTDNLAFSAFGAATGAGPTTATSTAAVAFPQSTANWGTVVAWGLFNAASSGTLLIWDWLGADPWYPATVTLASPGVVTAPGITAGSSPNLANGAAVVFTARFGGNIPTGFSAETAGTVAGLSSDTFNIGVNTSGTGACNVRQITQQSIPSNVTASFSSGSLVLTAA
jgi:hypothetical protein